MTPTGVWNLAVIENMKRLINPFIIKQYEILNKAGLFGKPKFFYFMYEKLQDPSGAPWENLIGLIHNFLSIYMKVKYNIKTRFNPVFFKQSPLNRDAFNIIVKKFNNFEIIEETGFIIAHVLRLLVEKKGSLLDNLETCVKLLLNI
jgi:hypothetical protein